MKKYHLSAEEWQTVKTSHWADELILYHLPLRIFVLFMAKCLSRVVDSHCLYCSSILFPPQTLSPGFCPHFWSLGISSWRSKITFFLLFILLLVSSLCSSNWNSIQYVTWMITPPSINTLSSKPRGHDLHPIFLWPHCLHLNPLGSLRIFAASIIVMMFFGTEASSIGSQRSFSSMSIYSLCVYLYVLMHVYA